LRKPRRRNSANSSSPYWARRDRNPFFIMNPDRTQLAAAGCVARENSGRHIARSGRYAQLAKINGVTRATGRPASVLSSPSPDLIGGLTRRSSNHRPGILDCIEIGCFRFRQFKCRSRAGPTSGQAGQ
jgi:hypothetical protein